MKTTLLTYLCLTQIATSCDLTFPAAKVENWPGKTYSVSSHASPIGFWSRRWYSCTKQLQDLDSLMKHGKISVPSCIATIFKVCTVESAYIFSPCLESVCYDQEHHQKLADKADSTNSNANTNKNKAETVVTITNNSNNGFGFLSKNWVYISTSIAILFFIFCIYKACLEPARICFRSWTAPINNNRATNQIEMGGVNNEAMAIEQKPTALPGYPSNPHKTTTIEA